MLLTGFESYGGRSLNPAEQVVKRLAGTEIGGVRVSGHTLPVGYRRARRPHRGADRGGPAARRDLPRPLAGDAGAAARADRGQHRGLRDPGQCRADDARPGGRGRRRGVSQHASDPCDPGPAAGRGHPGAALRQRRDFSLQRAHVPCAQHLRRARAGGALRLHPPALSARAGERAAPADARMGQGRAAPACRSRLDGAGGAGRGRPPRDRDHARGDLAADGRADPRAAPRPQAVRRGGPGRRRVALDRGRASSSRSSARAGPASRRCCGSSPASSRPMPARSCCAGATSATCRPGGAISAWSSSSTPISRT